MQSAFEQKIAETEMTALRAQMNPHFIFNALNSIRALVDENPERARKAITELSNILRSSMQAEKMETVPLQQELDIVRDYLALEHMRFEERLQIDLQIAEDTLLQPVPPMMLQTLVENAIKHGISVFPGNGMIRIEAFRIDDNLKIIVSNTGKLSSEKPLTGVGFKNSIQRLELLYGQKGKIFITEVHDLVVVDITIPLN